MSDVRAFAKINLALVVGPTRDDGKHDVVTVLQRIELHDEIALERGAGIVVEGFAGDTIVRNALAALARACSVDPGWHVHITKRIPIAAGLGGGSSDAATALRLANETLHEPLSRHELHRVATGVGADVPFFLNPGTQLATGDGSDLEPVELPTDYHVVLVVPDGVVKESTRAVYEAFDARGGAAGFADRAGGIGRALASVSTARDLARLPANDLAASSIAQDLLGAGAFRADVSGAGPTVYGLFEDELQAGRAAQLLEIRGRVVLTRPVTSSDHM